MSLYQLGEVAQSEGRNADAVKLFEDAISMFSEMKSPNAEIARKSLERLKGKSL